MSSEVLFARKASGLVREATLLDTILFGIMNNGAMAAVWYYLSTTPYLFPGVNQVLSFIIAAILLTFGFTMVWGFLGAAMPRSGGSYVYNSRIIHPTIGNAVSFCNAAFVMSAWIWVLAPWIADPGLVILVSAMGKPADIVKWWTQPVGMYLIATLANICALLVVIAGLRTYFRIQRVLIGWSLLGLVVCGVIYSTTSHQQFVAIWNQYAATYNSLTFEETIATVKQVFEIPETWDWVSTLGTLLPISWVTIYGYVIAFIGGEVKSPRRNIFIGQISNALIMLILTAWLGLAYEKMLGWDGWHAICYIENEGLEGYNFPFPPIYAILASMCVGFNPAVGVFLGLGFIFADFMWVVFSYIAFSRGLFAWGMDRLGPMWFTDVNPKVHQPLKLLFLEFILGQLGLTWYVVNPAMLAGFSVEVMQLFSVFGVTAISAIIFPYVKKVRHIWEASPHKEWKIAGIPMVTISGILALILVGTCIWANFYTEGMEVLNVIWTPIYIAVWISGLLWYFIWKWYRAKEGIDITLAFKELAPE